MSPQHFTAFSHCLQISHFKEVLGIMSVQRKVSVLQSRPWFLNCQRSVFYGFLFHPSSVCSGGEKELNKLMLREYDLVYFTNRINRMWHPETKTAENQIFVVYVVFILQQLLFSSQKRNKPKNSRDGWKQNDTFVKLVGMKTGERARWKWQGRDMFFFYFSILF